jgi:hypothetical protein
MSSRSVLAIPPIGAAESLSTRSPARVGSLSTRVARPVPADSQGFRMGRWREATSWNSRTTADPTAGCRVRLVAAVECVPTPTWLGGLTSRGGAHLGHRTGGAPRLRQPCGEDRHSADGPADLPSVRARGGSTSGRVRLPLSCRLMPARAPALPAELLSARGLHRCGSNMAQARSCQYSGRSGRRVPGNLLSSSR